VSRTIYFDINSALKVADWRQNAGWPIALAETHRCNRAGWKAFWPLVRSRERWQRDILLLAGSRIVWQCLALGEFASAAQEAAKCELEIAGAPPAIDYLMNASALDPTPPELAPTPFKDLKPTSFAGLRRVVRSATLSAPAAWPRMLIAPDAMALSYNPVMHDYARAHGLAVKFVHADDIMLAAQSRFTAETATPNWVGDTAVELAEAMLGERALDASYRSRLVQLSESFIKSQLRQAANTSAALRQLPQLPKNIWIGGQLSARYVAMEARRRGASVTGFEHGWGLACEDAAELTAYAELAIVDRFVAMTQISAERLKTSAAHRIASPEEAITFIGGDGDAGARRLRLDRKKKANGSAKPTVIYAPTIVAGFRQFLPPLMPDVVHLDWQFRLCENLMRLPINFTCRPHPEGVFRNRPHPLHAVLSPSNKKFEDLMDDADVFVFDFQQSTTFGRALCSDRGIVLIDLGTPAFDARTVAELQKRCYVIKARFDRVNRPFIDEDELREAVFAAAEEPVDASYFRDLMLGD